jgi:hypothetical protein
MSNDFEEGDRVLIVGTDQDGELGIIIGVVGGLEGPRYVVMCENGRHNVFNPENLSPRG